MRYDLKLASFLDHRFYISWVHYPLSKGESIADNFLSYIGGGEL